MAKETRDLLPPRTDRASREAPTHPGGSASGSGTPGSAATSADAPPRRGLLVTERVRLLRELSSGGMGTVWVAKHLTLDCEVAVKFLHAADDAKKRERLAREAQLAARIDHPNAARIFDQGQTPDGRPFIVMELIEGCSLAEHIEREGPMSLDQVQTLVAQVAGVLSAAHALGIVHRDVKPENIMLQRSGEGLFAKVLDFGVARPLDAETMALTADTNVSGTPRYMAPEQLIGGAPGDVRSDLWGLGVVVYETLSGSVPFEAPNRAALGANMALQRFAPLSERRPELPASLHDWFARALSIDPAGRFQSADELARAFERAATGAPAADGAASGDAAGADRAAGHAARAAASAAHGDAPLRIPDKLYGRRDELQKLRDAFEQASAGQLRVVLIEGYAGIGKTSLVDALAGSLDERGAVVVRGKLDPFDRGGPFDALAQAFRQRVRLILDEPSHRRDAWRERVVAAVGDGARALTELIPELEQLVGAQPALAEVSPAEARNRLHNAMRALVRALSDDALAWVLFIDDLQWADLASIELITALATSPDAGRLLLVGAYRENEVDAAHPLTAAIERMGAAAELIALGPLGEEALLDLVSETVGNAPGRLRLAMLCHTKTRGNAFFVRRFLESLHESGLLRFDAATQHWTWDLAEIEAQPVADNLVDFIADEISRMAGPTREALAVAACIGSRFELRWLAAALGVKSTEALSRTRGALAAELLLPDVDAAGARADLCLRFAHDGIRQAAHSLLDDAEAASVHNAVGRLMLEQLDAPEREQRLFELVEHLNRGALAAGGSATIASSATIAGSCDLTELRALNLDAARRALTAADFEAADRYYRQAHARLGEQPWVAERFEQTFAIHVEGARAAYLASDHATMDALLDAARPHARDALERVRVAEVRIYALVSQQRFAEAVSLAVEALAELDVALPVQPTGDDVGQAVSATLQALQACTAEQIAALPRAEDPRVVATQRIQNGVMSSAYLAVPDLVPILTANIVRATLEHGVCQESPYGFAVFALVLNAINLIDISYATGKLALQMLERVDDRPVRPKTAHVVRTHVNPFVEPIRNSIEHERQVHRLGMQSGDLEYAAWALHIQVCNAFYAGVPVDEVWRTFEHARATLEQHRQLPALSCTLPYGQALRNLAGASEAPARLVGPDYDEAEQLRALTEANFRGAAYIVTTVGAFLRLLFRELEDARRFADAGAQYADGCAATYHIVWWHQVRALAILGALPAGAPAAEADAALADVAPSLEQLRTWRGFSPVNHDHRVHLVEAELARVQGRRGDAMDGYDEAVRAAKAEGFTHEQALANELAARFHAGRGADTPARAYAREACIIYQRWGAVAKVEALRRELAALLRTPSEVETQRSLK